MRKGHGVPLLKLPMLYVYMRRGNRGAQVYFHGAILMP